MPQIIQLSLSPAEACNSENIHKAIAQYLSTEKENISELAKKILRDFSKPAIDSSTANEFIINKISITKRRIGS